MKQGNQSIRKRQKLAWQYLTFRLVLFARLGSTHQLIGKCENDPTAISYTSWFSNMKNEKFGNLLYFTSVGCYWLVPWFSLCNSLLVEEIDVGEEKVRQVVSGLAKYYGADELLVWENHWLEILVASLMHYASLRFFFSILHFDFLMKLATTIHSAWN